VARPVAAPKRSSCPIGLSQQAYQAHMAFTQIYTSATPICPAPKKPHIAHAAALVKKVSSHRQLLPTSKAPATRVVKSRSLKQKEHRTGKNPYDATSSHDEKNNRGARKAVSGAKSSSWSEWTEAVRDGRSGGGGRGRRHRVGGHERIKEGSAQIWRVRSCSEHPHHHCNQQRASVDPGIGVNRPSSQTTCSLGCSDLDHLSHEVRTEALRFIISKTSSGHNKDVHGLTFVMANAFLY